MTIKVEKSQIPVGSLVLAVSGGVDSVVLLDLMVKAVPTKRLIVAHVNHGMRPEAAWDQRFVAELARSYGLEFQTVTYRLKGRSEAAARQKRYAYLTSVAKEARAGAIVTAHHRDDLLETMVINTWRGTRGRGLIALRSRAGLYRPLLPFTKQELYRYALDNHLEFVEDSSNRQALYLRNRVRRRIGSRLGRSTSAQTQLDTGYQKLIAIYDLIDQQLASLTPYLAVQRSRWLSIDRQRFILLPSAIRREWLVYLIDRAGIERSRLSYASLHRMEEFICTARPGKLFVPQNSLKLRSGQGVVFMSFIAHPSKTRSGIRSQG